MSTSVVAKRKEKPDAPVVPKMTDKMRAWLAFYIDRTNPLTFFNKTQSALAAGYKSKRRNSLEVVGSQNYRKLKPLIDQWMDTEGFTEERVKAKFLTLIDAKEVKFFQKDGIVTDRREVDAIEVQRRTAVEMGKVLGMYKKDNEQQQAGMQSLSDTLRERLQARKQQELTE